MVESIDAIPQEDRDAFVCNIGFIGSLFCVVDAGDSDGAGA